MRIKMACGLVLVATCVASPAFAQSFVGTLVDLVITYTGVVSGDKFTGTVNMAGFEVPYSGVRVKPSG